jgi:hypothetical protein
MGKAGPLAWGEMEAGKQGCQQMTGWRSKGLGRTEAGGLQRKGTRDPQAKTIVVPRGWRRLMSVRYCESAHGASGGSVGGCLRLR